MSNQFKSKVECFLCGTPFVFGPHQYDGRYIASYAISVCRVCLSANWDGLAPGFEEKFLAHLNAKGLSAPSRNEKGWYPLDV